MRLAPASVRTRLTLWYTAALALPLVAFAVASYLIFSDTVRLRTDAFLGDALTVFARELGAERRAGPAIDVVIRRTLDEVRFREVDILILDADASVIGASTPPRAAARGSGGSTMPDAGRLAPLIGALPTGQPHSVRLDGRAFRVLARPLPAAGRPLRIAGVQPLAGVEAMLRRIRRLFLIAIPLTLACAAAGASFLARRSLRPVSAMAAHAAAIGASTLHERLPVDTDDELGGLARVLNGLLDRLERSFEQQRRFMTDASHELRTPATIVRSEADITLSRPHRSEEEYRASLGVVQDAARRLTRIVDDLFLIARADAGHLVLVPGPVYLDDLVRDTVRVVKPIAEQRHVAVELRTADELPVTGDADLLGRLVLNLLDNAIRHSPAGGTVDLSLRLRGSDCVLSIVDAGPGIPPDALDRVFERFFRLDISRSRDESTLTGGAGLGLSICRRIAELHGGAVALVDSRPGRTEFRVSLPLASPTRPTRPAPVS